MEDTDDQPMTPGATARHWQMQLSMADKDHKSFIQNGRDVYERYMSEEQDGRKTNTKRRVNILYSNTEVKRAALYGRTAKPDVRRRFPDRDPIAKQTAIVVERALSYCADSYPMDAPIEAAVQDFLLPGRGVVRVQYEPVFGQQELSDPFGLPMIGEDGEAAYEDIIADQKLRLQYVFWEDYLHEPARNWEGVSWVAFRHTFSSDELEKEVFESAPQSSKTFGDAAEVPLNWAPDNMGSRELPDDVKKAEVWEVWCKKRRERLWIVHGHTKPLRIDTDPLQLEGFFPLPEPPTAYAATDTIVPQPEFFTYKDQADDLDEITTRISRLTRAMKRRGIYDKSVPELKRLGNANDNEFIAAENYAALTQKGGLTAAFQTEDLGPTAKVLGELYRQKEMLVQAIYEVTGISDIIRGSTKASETATAQNLKSQFGSLRLKRQQRQIQRWIKDIYKIKAEIIAEHFEPDVLQQMTGIQVMPEMVDLMRSDKMRGYSIDVETDSTVFEDEQAEKQARIEVLGAIGQFMTQSLPVAQAQPILVPVMMEMLGFTVRTFKAGRELEDKFEEAAQQLQDQVQKAMQNPQPNPEAERAKIEMEMARENHEMDKQAKIIDLQTKRESAGIEQQKQQGDLQAHAIKSEMDLNAAANKAEMDVAKTAMQLEAQMQKNANLFTN
jgi:hypothetical protein